MVNPPRRHDQTRVEYLIAEPVNSGAPQHVVDHMVTQIIENRRTWSDMMDDGVHGMSITMGKGYPVS